MALYEKPVRLLMQDMAKELAGDSNRVFTKNEAISWFREHYPRIKTGTVTAHLVRLSTNARSRTHYSARPGQDDVLYQLDGSHFRLYRSDEDPKPIYSPEDSGFLGETIPEGEDEADIATPSGSDGEFAYEADLRNYLSRNLGSLESGLRLYEEEGIRGIEFPVGGRFIDILAVDSSNNLVVIELKVSRGYDRVVGQLMRYVAWVKQNLAEDAQKVRGMIVARQISQDLILACSLVPDVELHEYELSLSLKRIEPSD